MTPKEFIGNKVSYDNEGTYFWSHQGDQLQMLADLRGWGAIQNLFKDKDGRINFNEAAKFQDEIGAYLADAINEKLKRDNQK